MLVNVTKSNVNSLEQMIFQYFRGIISKKINTCHDVLL